MPGNFLIDVTDARFKIDANAEVMRFVAEVNPFAHSDVGDVLIRLGKELPDVLQYCPSFKSCAYVVLHTPADRIFAIAYGQRALSVRLHDDAVEEALAGGLTPDPLIGPDWVGLPPWPTRDDPFATGRLRLWCRRAWLGAVALDNASTRNDDDD